MFPKLFSYGSFALPTYGVLVALGLVAGMAVALRLARQAGLDQEKVYNLGIYVALGGILGSKVFLIFQDRDYYWRHPGEIFSFATLQSGGIFYGGLITAIAVALWYTRKHRLAFLKTADAFAPGIALGHAFGRLGCFAAGCCWGEPSNVPWAVAFHDPYAHQVVGVPLEIRLHPTQLYEAAAGLLIFAFLYSRYSRKRFDGQILGWYLLLYPAARFVVEFFRSHSGDALFWGNAVSDAQMLSLLLFAFAVWLLWFSPYRHRQTSSVVLSHESTVPQRERAAKLPGH